MVSRWFSWLRLPTFCFFTCCYTCYTFTCAWLRGPALDIAPDVAVLRVFLRLLGLLLRFHWAFLALDCAPAAPDPRLLAPDSFDAWAWFRGSAFALRFLCTLLCACLRLLLHLILIRPEIKRKRLRFLSRLLVRLLLRLLSHLMVNPHWVVHFHFIFGFSFEGKPSQILQIWTWGLELQIWSLLQGIWKRNGRIWTKSRDPLLWSVWPPWMKAPYADWNSTSIVAWIFQCSLPPPWMKAPYAGWIPACIMAWSNISG